MRRKKKREEEGNFKNMGKKIVFVGVENNIISIQENKTLFKDYDNDIPNTKVEATLCNR